MLYSYQKEMPLYIVPTSKVRINWWEHPLYGLREIGMESPIVMSTAQLQAVNCLTSPLLIQWWLVYFYFQLTNYPSLFRV